MTRQVELTHLVYSLQLPDQLRRQFLVGGLDPVISNTTATGWANAGWHPESGALPDPGSPEYVPPADEEDRCYENHDRCVHIVLNALSTVMDVSDCVIMHLLNA